MAERGRVILFLLAWALLPVQAQTQIKANAAFDPARVETGDTFSLRVLVTGVPVAPKRVSFAAWQNQLPAENILSRSEWTRSGAQWVQHFTLIAFDSAAGQLPPLTVHLHLGDTVQTNPLELSVTPTPAGADLGDMDTIRDIRREPTLWLDYWPWALGALALMLLFTWYLRRRPKRPKQVVAASVPLPPPPPPARDIAQQKLTALEQQELWQKGQLIEYYAQLSIILREYLENKYNILALESTTREIAKLLQNTSFPQSLKPTLDYLLQQSDMVKYAEMPPPAQFHVQAMENARKVVRDG